MAKYSKGAQKGVESAMKRMEKGTLRSGKSDKKVTDPKQAIAIGLSEAKKKGAKVHDKKAATKKAAPKKAAAKKAAPKKAAVKKAAPKKAAPKKAAIKKAAPQKTATKIAAKKTAKKPDVSPQKKDISKKAPVKKAVVKKETLLATNENKIVQGEPTPMAGHEEQFPVHVQAPVPVAPSDRKFYDDVVPKKEPHTKIRLSTSKSSIKPVGKKPLWN
ncbi:MAG: DUF6496 domain-containing protein [Bacteroidota bacterium]